MSTTHPKLSATVSLDEEKDFEQIDLGPIHPVVVVQPLPDPLLQESDQSEAERRIVTAEEAKEHTAYAYNPGLKWRILAALWMVSITLRCSPQPSEPRYHSTTCERPKVCISEKNVQLTTH